MTFTETAGMRATADGAGEHWPFMRYFAICAAVVLLFIFVDILDGTLFNGDIDDVLREMEIRNLVQGAGWFDLSIPQVRLPEVYVAPWSRLVDLPYALIAWTLEPLLGQDRALAAAFNLWPPVMAVFYTLAIVATLRQLMPKRSDLSLAMLLAVPVFAAISIWEFSPGRIDHHNVQILFLAALAYGVARWDRCGGAIAGIAVSVSMAVGLETMPVLATALAAVCICWIASPHGSREMLLGLGLSTAVATLCLMVALVEPSRYLAMQSDMFSAPYIVALVGFGFVSTLVCLVAPPSWTWLARAIVLGVGGLLVLAVTLGLYPAMIHGPLPMIKGLAKTYWFDRIDQEKSFFSFFSSGDQRALAPAPMLAVQIPIQIALMAASLPIAIANWRRDRPALLVILAIAAAAFFMECMATRFLRLAPGIVSLLFPVAMLYFVSPEYRRRGKQVLISALVLLTIAGGVRLYAFPFAPRPFDAFDYFVMTDCRDEDFSKLRNLPKGRVMSAPSLGLMIVYKNNPNLDVSVIAYHRASAAISNVLQVMMGRTLSENSGLLAGADYLAICRAPTGLPNEAAMPVLADLLAGRPVRGLELLTGDRPIMVYRIDHAAIR